MCCVVNRCMWTVWHRATGLHIYVYIMYCKNVILGTDVCDRLSYIKYCVTF
jgi:hypothetical protein